MKIGIDISIQCMPRSGIGQYQYNLLKNILQIDRDNFYHLYAFNYRWRHKFNQLKFSASNYEIKVTPLPQRAMILWWLMCRYPPLERVTAPCDIYHISEIGVQPTKKAKTVASIYDLTTILYPQYHLKQNIFFYNRRFYNIKRYVDGVITESESTKRDIIKYLGIAENKIYVTPFAANDSFRSWPDEVIKPVLAKYNLDKPYIMFLGTLEPRKNVPTLIRAWQRLKERQIPHQLLLVGQPGWFYDEIAALIESSPFKRDIILTGYVPDEDIPALLNGATVFVYPSFYEGFGLPVLEAMQCGTPVITSRTSSMPEVGGEACLYIDPRSVEDLSKTIDKVLSDQALQIEMRQKGLKQASHFSWKKCAEQTLKIYEKVAMTE